MVTIKDGPPVGMLPGSPMALLDELLRGMDVLVQTSWHDYAHADADGDADEDADGGSRSGVEAMLVTVEQIKRRLAYVEAELIRVGDANSLWAASGFRSINTWLQTLTGSSRRAAGQGVRLSRALGSELPLTADSLVQGQISAEHAAVLQREATATDLMREQLRDPEHGEGFLIGIAQHLNADDFRKAVKHWGTMADPEAADRRWREESDAQEVFLSAVGDSYHLFGRLNLDSGRALETALNAQMGRKGADDERPPAKRRADALVSWALSWLDSGALKPGSRIRPHLSVHVPYETLQALSEATGSAVPPNQSFTPGISSFQTLRAPGGPKEPPTQANPGTDATGDLFDAQGWVDSWRAEEDHVISTAVDHTRLRGVAPATLDDGTAIPPSVLGRIACGSSLTRIVFGPQSTIIDVGREQRIFPANQTRAIIARDRHCQYPSCTEPPEFGEIHHSLWWWKHNGKTSTDQGILLCWHHHAHVHEKNITITRIDGTWVFSTEQGQLITGVPGATTQKQWRPMPAHARELPLEGLVEGSPDEVTGEEPDPWAESDLWVDGLWVPPSAEPHDRALAEPTAEE